MAKFIQSSLMMANTVILLQCDFVQTKAAEDARAARKAKAERIFQSSGRVYAHETQQIA
jgi:hypothetical protein